MRKKEMLFIIITVVLVVAVMYFTGIGCPILKLTGIPCFGCGMTRACIRLVHFDFAGAFYYHPLVYLMPFCIVALLFAKKMPKRMIKMIGIIVVVLFILVYFIRLFDPENEIVKWHIENGMIVKGIYRLLQ